MTFTITINVLAMLAGVGWWLVLGLISTAVLTLGLQIWSAFRPDSIWRPQWDQVFGRGGLYAILCGPLLLPVYAVGMTSDILRERRAAREMRAWYAKRDELEAAELVEEQLRAAQKPVEPPPAVL